MKTQTPLLIKPVLVFLLLIPYVVAAQDSTESGASADKLHPLLPAFQSLDADADQFLSVEEFRACKKRALNALDRDFVVFDQDVDAKLSFNESLAIPYLTPVEHRQSPDAIVQLAAEALHRIREQWSALGIDVTSGITQAQFEDSNISQLVMGLQDTTFSDWDRNQNSQLTLEEVTVVLDLAFGIRHPQGEQLRKANGAVVDLRVFDLLNNTVGVIRKDDYVKRRGMPVDMGEELFKTLDTNADGILSLEEYLQDQKLWSNPIDHFLIWDTNFDARLSQQEIDQAAMAPGQRAHTFRIADAFDLDQSGDLSLNEFQLTPLFNLYTVWVWAKDLNADGAIDKNEFRFSDGVYLKSLSALFLKQLDENQNQQLSLNEWDFITDHPSKSFRQLDQDFNEQLSLTEFLAGKKQVQRFTRDFQVFDFNQDQQLSYTEFATHPSLVAAQYQSPVPDPVVDLMSQHLEVIQQVWRRIRNDQSQGLSQEEFLAIEEFKQIPGLQSSPFESWDLNADQQLDLEEVRRFLEIAYGVRNSLGVLLRDGRGRVLDLRSFNAIRGDAQGISKDRFLAVSDPKRKEQQNARFQQTDLNGDQVLSLEEWANPNGFWHDSLGLFLAIDTDLNGRVSDSELSQAKLPAGQKSMTLGCVPAFDADHDGQLSYLEFRLIPACNLLAIWNQAKDDNQDGELSEEEFRFADSFPLRALAAEYFQNFDRNRDGKLQLDEWSFSTSHPKSKFIKADLNQDGLLSKEEFAAFNSKESANLERDRILVDLDGNGELSFAEFSLIPALIPEKFRGELPNDPVIALADAAFEKVLAVWKEGDKDQSGGLRSFELNAVQLGDYVPRLDKVKFTDWDRNDDLEIDQAEVESMVAIAYGLKSWHQIPLRKTSGKVIDLRGFRTVENAQNEQFGLKEYLKSPLARDSNNPQAAFGVIDRNQDGTITLLEWSAKKNIWVEPLSAFQRLDTDLDARLSREELLQAKLPAGQKIFVQYLLPAFDLNRDDVLDLNEFRLTPLVNLLVQWGSANDFNDNGQLEIDEFTFSTGPQVVLLAAYYFSRLDLDQDGHLDTSEWIFNYDPLKVPREIVFQSKDIDQNQQLSLEELIGDAAVPRQGQAFDLNQEKRFMRAEEAFRRADSNGNGALELAEFKTDAGLEVIAPESAKLAKKVVVEPNAKNIPLYAILGFNGLMIVAFLLFLFRKRPQA